jgi:hypothetical protein
MNVSQEHLGYSGADESIRPNRSRLGVTSFILAILQFPLAAVVLLLFGGTLTVSRDPSGDRGGPLFALLGLGVLGFLAFLLLVVWILGLIFAVVGVSRTDPSCKWSFLAAILHVVIFVLVLVVGLLQVAYI